MTQRNFRNPRNLDEGKKGGNARKSASSVKLKSVAGASVHTGSAQSKKSEKKKRRKEMTEEERHEEQQERRREQALAASAGTLPEYKKWRRRWWISLIVAIVAVGVSWGFSAMAQNGMLPDSMLSAVSPVSIVGLIIGYAAIIYALWIDLGKIRKIRKAQEEKARNLTKRQKRELDAAMDANDKEYEAELQSGRGFRMPWSKKNAIENDGQGNVTDDKYKTPAKKSSKKGK